MKPSSNILHHEYNMLAHKQERLTMNRQYPKLMIKIKIYFDKFSWEEYINFFQDIFMKNTLSQVFNFRHMILPLKVQTVSINRMKKDVLAINENFYIIQMTPTPIQMTKSILVYEKVQLIFNKHFFYSTIPIESNINPQIIEFFTFRYYNQRLNTSLEMN